MNTVPSFDDIRGCQVESVELFEFSIKIKLSKKSRRFSLIILGEIDIGKGEELSSYILGNGVLELRNVVGSVVCDVLKNESQITIQFINEVFIQIRASKENDYMVSYHEQNDETKSHEVLE